MFQPAGTAMEMQLLTRLYPHASHCAQTSGSLVAARWPGKKLWSPDLSQWSHLTSLLVLASSLILSRPLGFGGGGATCGGVSAVAAGFSTDLGRFVFYWLSKSTF
jgi:hypothetical protein